MSAPIHPQPGGPPRHLPGTEDANVVNTTFMRAARAGLTAMARLGGIVIIDGGSGTGKSFSAWEAVKQLPQPCYWVDMPDSPKGKETTSRIYRALAGHLPPNVIELHLLEDVVDLLADRQVTLVVDEAQNLTRASFRQLRYLHDRRETRYLLVMVGAGVLAGINRSTPELANRVGRMIQFKPIPPKQLRSVLCAYHPIFANTEPDVLKVFHGRIGGNFRLWARVLEQAHSAGIDSKAGIALPQARGILHSLALPHRVEEAAS